MQIVVIGGGWGGCAAALSARKAGAQVTLLERTDMLLGTGLAGGIMRNNGRYTATEEMIALGGGELFRLCDEHSLHSNVNFPGHEHASLYNTITIHGAVLQLLQAAGVTIHFQTRITGLELRKQIIKDVIDQHHNSYPAAAFVDATGTAGPTCNCALYGHGCAMCIIRCPSFGGRISVTALAGIKEIFRIRPNGKPGAMSGSCSLVKDSLGIDIRHELDRKGVVIIPGASSYSTNQPEADLYRKQGHLEQWFNTILCQFSDIHSPSEVLNRLLNYIKEAQSLRKASSRTLSEEHLSLKVCQQYALPEFKDNLILLDTGHAKLMKPYYPLERLQRIPGFENAVYASPAAGGKGNSLRFLALSPRDNTLKVEGLNNLFCCGEKTGLLGHTEAIVTGTLAGFNAVRKVKTEPLLEFPETLAVGDGIAFVNQEMQRQRQLGGSYTFSGAVCLERLRQIGLYTTDRSRIQERISRNGLKNVFS